MSKKTCFFEFLPGAHRIYTAEEGTMATV